MSLHNYKVILMNGTTETEVEADSIMIADGHGCLFNINLIKNIKGEGRSRVYADNLIIEPIASNCVRIKSGGDE